MFIDTIVYYGLHCVTVGSMVWWWH